MGYKYNPQFCQLAIDTLSEGKSIMAVAAACKINRDTVYDWMTRYPEFGEAMEFGLVQSQAWWEAEGIKGMQGKYEKFSANIWMFTMKNRFRRDYQEDRKDDNKDATASLLEKIMSGEIVINKA